MGSSRRSDFTGRQARSLESSPRPTSKVHIRPLNGIVKPAAHCRPEDLRLLYSHLSTAVNVTNVCVAALEAQAADCDADVAEVLRRYVSDPLSEKIEQLDRLIAGGAS
jgi:hypothetical protein